MATSGLVSFCSLKKIKLWQISLWKSVMCATRFYLTHGSRRSPGNVQGLEFLHIDTWTSWSWSRGSLWQVTLILEYRYKPGAVLLLLRSSEPLDLILVLKTERLRWVKLLPAQQLLTCWVQTQRLQGVKPLPALQLPLSWVETQRLRRVELDSGRVEKVCHPSYLQPAFYPCCKSLFYFHFLPQFKFFL